MAGCDENDLPDAMGTLSVVNDCWIELGLDDNIRTQLKKIENDYESIFSWGIQRLTGVNQCLMLNLITKVREKLEFITDMEENDDVFNVNRFYLQLIACYELYISKSYKESYMEIEMVVKFMETCKFEFKEEEQYFDAYSHIAWATIAYIGLTLKIDSKKLLNDIKQINNFNCIEKAAICAVKARIFMEYSPKGNGIALELAEQACKVHSAEPEWILTWLKAKGRVRRYYDPLEMPGDDEIDAADNLMKSNPKFMFQASQLYKEVGYIYKTKNNFKESDKFYKLSFDIAKRYVELAIDNGKQLCFILLICVDHAKELFPKSIMDNIVTKLSNVNNSLADHTLGMYFLKHEKDYVKAKIHLSRAGGGRFNSALQLIKVECLLQPVNEFPYVQKLNQMYDDFLNPLRRLIILSHILIYYNYCEQNPKEMMRYLKLFIEQDIEDTLKKRILIFARPFVKVYHFLKPNEFINTLSLNVKELKYYKWSIEEKQEFDYTSDRFNKILKLIINFNDDNKTTIHKRNESWRKQVNLSENKSNESHQQKNESWRKQQVNLSENKSYVSHQQKNESWRKKPVNLSENGSTKSNK